MKLCLHEVTKIIRGTTVIDHVSMNSESGRVYGLNGYNGCGKTMLMRLISGLIRPSAGTVKFDDKVLGQDIDFPNSIGIMIETPAFLNNYSGYDNLKLLASIKCIINNDQIHKTLKRVGLSNVSTKAVRKYSLGMKQRLGIAAAIMEQPELLILDEPTNALDSDGIDQIKRIITEERDRGALVIMTCHNHDILMELSDVIFNMNQGRIEGVEVNSHENESDN